jgi:hypothetical protein
VFARPNSREDANLGSECFRRLALLLHLIMSQASFKSDRRMCQQSFGLSGARQYRPVNFLSKENNSLTKSVKRVVLVGKVSSVSHLNCIAEEDLDSYFLRRTTERQSERIEEHLLFCRQCQDQALKTEQQVLFLQGVLRLCQVSAAA